MEAIISLKIWKLKSKLIMIFHLPERLSGTLRANYTTYF